ncbi:MAG: hypothetical protein HYV15_05010 [Elusimicrobia bacterium]|nr:hypothetical protein [Elusimicrobiota bacterium]
MTLAVLFACGAVFGALGSYALFFSAQKAADPAELARRVAALESRVGRLEGGV